MDSVNLKPVAKEVLSAFEEIEHQARAKVQAISEGAESGLAGGNTFTGAEAFESLRRASRANREGYMQLQKEPAIARLVLENEKGEREIYYIARYTVVPLNGAKLASYRSKIGRFAEIPIGDEETVVIDEKSRTYSVVEKADLYPVHQAENWDSKDTIVRLENEDVFTLPSLLALLREISATSGEELERLLAREAETDNVRKGVIHEIRTAITLRDQPILDRFQGNIFRLPINRQLLILGPPGTGKTTTLIKRLGQKLDTESLDAHERRLVDGQAHEGPYDRSWLMFTPSELLKQYLKEAFSREGIPASDANIKTWEVFRNQIARNTLGILRSTNSGRFELNGRLNNVPKGVARDPREFFEAFNKFHQERVHSDIEAALQEIQPHELDLSGSSVRKLQDVVQRNESQELLELMRSLDSINEPLKEALEKLRGKANSIVKQQRNLLHNTDQGAFQRLADRLPSQPSYDFDSEDESDEDLTGSKTFSESEPPLHRAVKAYERALRNAARSAIRGRKIPETSRTAEVFNILGVGYPEAELLAELGELISSQGEIRKLVRALRRLVMDIPASYLKFRRSEDAAKFLQLDQKFDQSLISNTELDLIVASMVVAMRDLLSQNFIIRNIDDQRFEWLASLSTIQKTQIFVDEATDFSLLQLAAIEGLATTRTKSFFACGDFNQRITSNGIQSKNQFAWISKTIEIQTINTVYRQSRRLNEFSRKLVDLMGGDQGSVGTLSEESAHDGVLPTLLERAGDVSRASEWIAGRIREVENAVERMPSIAVIVDQEKEVGPVASALTAILGKINLRAVPCSRGEILGDQSDVRVFAVQHIKGLEFEAVFFLGLDRLAKRQPGLFSRFLYVGATRAATYLGLVCYDTLPEDVRKLELDFSDCWQ